MRELYPFASIDQLLVRQNGTSVGVSVVGGSWMEKGAMVDAPSQFSMGEADLFTILVINDDGDDTPRLGFIEQPNEDYCVKLPSFLANPTEGMPDLVRFDNDRYRAEYVRFYQLCHIGLSLFIK